MSDVEQDVRFQIPDEDARSVKQMIWATPKACLWGGTLTIQKGKGAVATFQIVTCAAR